MKREVWIGLVDVKPKPGNDLFGGSPGAYTNALVLASDEREYRQAVSKMLGSLDLEIIEIKEVEPLRVRREHYHVPDEILDLADKLSHDVPGAYDTFYIYESE